MGIKQTQYLILLISLFVGGFILSNQFVAKKKEKLPSTNTLKMDCCELHTEIIKMVPEMMRVIADVQQQAFEVLERYCKGESSCFTGASKEQLAKYGKLLNNIATLCQNFTTEINAQLRAINELKIV